ARACYAARILRSPAKSTARRLGSRPCLIAIGAMLAVLCSAHDGGGARRDGVRRERGSHRARASRPAPPPAPPEETTPNAHLVLAGTIALPGRGLSLAWAPDGTRLAVGGHFRDPETHLRYDTRIADVTSGTLVKSFACHWFWAVSQAWVDHPDYGG